MKRPSQIISNTFADKPPLPMQASFSNSSLAVSRLHKDLSAKGAAQRVKAAAEHGSVSRKMMIDQQSTGDNNQLTRQSTDGAMRRRFRGMLASHIQAGTGSGKHQNLRNKQIERFVDQFTVTGPKHPAHSSKPESLGAQFHEERHKGGVLGSYGQGHLDSNPLEFIEESNESIRPPTDNAAPNLNMPKSSTLSFTQINITSATKNA